MSILHPHTHRHILHMMPRFPRVQRRWASNAFIYLGYENEKVLKNTLLKKSYKKCYPESANTTREWQSSSTNSFWLHYEIEINDGLIRSEKKLAKS